MNQDRLEKDICVCETERCGNKTLRHFEECPICGSTAYHKTIHSYEEEQEESEGGNE